MLKAYRTEILPNPKQAMCNAEQAFKNYMQGKANRLKFKKKRQRKVKAYEGIGIDLGVKELAVMSDGAVKPNINKTLRVKKPDKKLRREQRRLSRKYESKKKRGEKPAAYSANYRRECGMELNRDLNAAINLRNATEYKIA